MNGSHYYTDTTSINSIELIDISARATNMKISDPKKQITQVVYIWLILWSHTFLSKILFINTINAFPRGQERKCTTVMFGEKAVLF